MMGYVLLAAAGVVIIGWSCKKDALMEKLELAVIDAAAICSHADPEIAANAAELERRSAEARAYCNLNGLTPRYSSFFAPMPDVAPNVEIQRATIALEDRSKPEPNPDHVAIAARIRAKYAFAGELSSQEVH